MKEPSFWSFPFVTLLEHKWSQGTFQHFLLCISQYIYTNTQIFFFSSASETTGEVFNEANKNQRSPSLFSSTFIYIFFSHEDIKRNILWNLVRFLQNRKLRTENSYNFLEPSLRKLLLRILEVKKCKEKSKALNVSI